MSFPTSKAFWYRGADIPTIVMAGAFRAATVGERGGLEVEVPSTLYGIWLIGVSPELSSTINFLRNRGTQFLTTAPATVAATGINVFGPTGAVSLAVARTGTSAAGPEGVSFSQNVNNVGEILFRFPLWVPSGNWVSFYNDPVNTISAVDLIWVEVPKTNG